MSGEQCSVMLPCIKRHGHDGVHASSYEDIDPIPMLLHCPECGTRHIDVGKFATKVHRTHSCQECGMTWRPAVVATVGVQFLPGFKDGE